MRSPPITSTTENMPYANINSKSLFYSLTTSSSLSTTNLPLTLVFIHGLGSSSSFYSPILAHLTALGHSCLTFDTHGSGCSHYTGSGNSIASITSDLNALLDLLSITENVVLVGHSMGCIVASNIAADLSRDKHHRFKAVVLIGPVDPSPGAADLFRKRIGVVEKDGMEPLAASVPAAATGSISTPVVHSFIRSLLLGSSPAGYISLCKAIAEASTPQYRNIEVPLLIIAGAEDMSAPLEGAVRIMDQYGSHKKELRILQGVGHWHVLEAYLQVQELIGGFLNELC